MIEENKKRLCSRSKKFENFNVPAMFAEKILWTMQKVFTLPPSHVLNVGSRTDKSTFQGKLFYSLL